MGSRIVVVAAMLAFQFGVPAVLAQPTPGSAFCENSTFARECREWQETILTVPACPGSYDAVTWTSCIGERVYANGGKYIGQHRDGKSNGQGTFIFPTGSKYVGEWRDGLQQGQGIYTFNTGQKYAGSWKDGKFNGQGTYTNADGSRYVGQHKDGQRDGSGSEFRADGSLVRTGTYTNGAFVTANAAAPQKASMSLDIRFDPGSVALTAAAVASLDALVGKIAELKQMEVIIILGYADASDGNMDKQQLSMQRALAAVTYFAGKGLDPKRLFAEAAEPGKSAGGPGGSRVVQLEVIGTR